MDDPHEPSEFGSIARWLAALPTPGPSVLEGPGSDVAWVQSAEPLALSVDTMVEGTHFLPGWLTDEQVGRKALAAALSDLAAAGAAPLGCLVALTLPSLERGDGVMAGVRAGSERWACPILGGDTTRGPFTASITVLGSGRVLSRRGARVGDVLQISGPLGHAAAAVAALTAGATLNHPQRRAFEDPEPRLDLRPSLTEATACVDVSDGLLADAGHLAEASGVGLELEPAAIPGDPEHALHGGEDYELLATAPSLLPGFTAIGRVVVERGLSFADGSPLPRRRGWDHGR